MNTIPEETKQAAIVLQSDILEVLDVLHKIECILDTLDVDYFRLYDPTTEQGRYGITSRFILMRTFTDIVRDYSIQAQNIMENLLSITETE
ncbi:hypothetical protein NIF40_12130 [[Clostridium] leptum]|nr:hypothetical protein [[Clostridium] leptum]